MEDMMAWAYKVVRAEDLCRWEDDGGHVPPPEPYLPAEERLPRHIIKDEWGRRDFDRPPFGRVYVCDRCGWYVWHPLQYCQKCPGKLRILRGSSSELQGFLKSRGYEDGGF